MDDLKETETRAMKKALINEIIRMLVYTDDMDLIDLVYVLLLNNGTKNADTIRQTTTNEV